MPSAKLVGKAPRSSSGLIQARLRHTRLMWAFADRAIATASGTLSKDLSMASFEQWAALVKRQMVELGMSSTEAFFAVDENHRWFVEQHEAGASSGITADEWFNQHLDGSPEDSE